MTYSVGVAVVSVATRIAITRVPPPLFRRTTLPAGVSISSVTVAPAVSAGGGTLPMPKYASLGPRAPVAPVWHV